MKITKQGFTLIELLVVVAIIGLLATIILYSVSTIKAKSRDARRVTDVKVIQQGLSMYYNDNFLYPDSGGSAIEINGSSDDMSQALINNGSMNGLPVDPLNGDMGGVTYKYYYQSLDSQDDYELTFYLETNTVQNRSQGINVVKP